MSLAEPYAPQPHRLARWAATAATALKAAGPALLFGMRLWASVCLALYVAFWLELDTPSWAATTAALSCQPQLGASLRKGWFRMVGTAVGAIAGVLLAAFFPQNRTGFLLGLALWIAVCTFGATILRNFAAYAAALAGFTTAIIAADDLGEVGGSSGQAFMLAVNRASEICLGIVCAGIVLAGSDFGGARRRLTARFAALTVEITNRLMDAVRLIGPEPRQALELRRDLARRVIALDPVIDQAIGESSNLRYRSRQLQAAVEGLFTALSAWFVVALHLEHYRPEQAGQTAETILDRLPQPLRGGSAAEWAAAPSGPRRICGAAIRAMLRLPAATVAQRALADSLAGAFIGIARALDGLVLLADDPAGPAEEPRIARLRIADWLPAVVNATRALVVIAAFELFWVVTAWPGGAAALIWAAVGVGVFAASADQAYAAAMAYTTGVILAAVAAAIVNFAVLPQIVTFAGLSIVLGLYLVPIGAMMGQPWRTPVFAAMAGIFMPLLAPRNQAVYDTWQFYNSTLAIVAGLVVSVLSFRVIPPLTPAFRTRRLLARALRDLRRLARRAGSASSESWRGRMYSRLRALPDEARPEERSYLVAALAVGDTILRLRRLAERLDVESELAAALDAVTRGESAIAIRRFTTLDAAVATRLGRTTGATARLRARASILAITEALTQYSAYFDGTVSG